MNAKMIEVLNKYGQSQLLRFFDELTPAEKAELEGQIAEIDFAKLDNLIKEYVLVKPQVAIPEDLQPAPFFPLVPRDAEQQEVYAKAHRLGEEAIRAGEVACLTVAGGQGTRLGFDGPKGTYPIGPVSGQSLFNYFADSIKRTGEKYHCQISWYIMTSVLNHEATLTFFEDNEFFGLRPEQVFFFVQGTMPAVGLDGKLLLGNKHGLSLSPDGHGGTLLALRKSGALEKMRDEGVRYLSYFQVDNPLVKIIDPLFVGMHLLEKSQMSAIMLAKTNAFEKLGNFCIANGHLEIIEYSDLPENLATSVNPDGSLRFLAGSPAIHVISCDFIENLTKDGSLNLPYHRADKKVSYIDNAGCLITPETPNAVKLESFIFDALPLASKTMLLEGARCEVFGPTKNATGVDSVESCRQLLMERDARRLEAAGVEVPRTAAGKLDCAIEIPPYLAIDDEDVFKLAKKLKLKSLKSGQKYLIGE